MRRFLLLILALGAFPCIMFAQSYFGNFGSSSQVTPTYKPSSQGTSIPAPIPTVATPQEFRASITQSADQNRVDAQYQELLAKQPPLKQKTPSLEQPIQPPPAAVPPSTSTTTTVSTTTTKPAAAVPPPPTAIPAAPTAPQVQIERAPATTTTTQTTPPPSNGNLLQPPTQTQVYTGFQPPKNEGQGGTQTNNQGGWNIKY